MLASSCPWSAVLPLMWMVLARTPHEQVRKAHHPWRADPRSLKSTHVRACEKRPPMQKKVGDGNATYLVGRATPEPTAPLLLCQPTPSAAPLTSDPVCSPLRLASTLSGRDHCRCVFPTCLVCVSSSVPGIRSLIIFLFIIFLRPSLPRHSGGRREESHCLRETAYVLILSDVLFQQLSDMMVFSLISNIDGCSSIVECGLYIGAVVQQELHHFLVPLL